ncbi:MAG: dephospho-CoA kinase [Verrucomicrobia bacterium]|nr:dephospho-CoA kinase [Verrucomicrobiota bacterium]
MTLIGLTGGLGMGKSAAAELLRRRGVPLVDSDVIARQVVEPGQPALAEIAAQFGPEVIGPDGRLRRDRLANRVFRDDAQRKQLEAILHPRIRAVWSAQAVQWRREKGRCGVAIIPLLFEVGAVGDFDRVLCVACSRPTQLERLQPRGWSQEEIDRRCRAQWPVEKKMAAADFVVWSEGTLDILGAQLDRVLASL